MAAKQLRALYEALCEFETFAEVHRTFWSEEFAATKYLVWLSVQVAVAEEEGR